MTRSHRRALLGWATSVLSLAYVAWCYRGLGPNEDDAWWAPTEFLHQWSWLGELATEPFEGADVLALALPALALCGATFAATRAALPRTLALASVPCSVLIGVYGLHAFFPWEFFGWRGSLALVTTGFVIGAAAAAPLLAQQWRRAPGIGPTVVYALLALTAILVQTHATGWDEGAAFNLSPWPAVPIFALDIVGYLLAGLQLAVGLALISRQIPPWLAVASGALLLWGWTAARFGTDLPGLPILALAFAVPLALAWWFGNSEARAALGRNLVLGGLLLATPILAGRAIASGDHAHTRHILANQIIAGLQQYYEREEVYPDHLDELVAVGDLTSIPEPRIGFRAVYALGMLTPPRFGYQSMGSSYVLEFSSTEWVQCFYSPPWIDDEEPEPEDEAEEPWSCPANQPELW